VALERRLGIKGVKAGRIGDEGSDEGSASEDMGCRLRGLLSPFEGTANPGDLGSRHLLCF
jgi:hypothetical protein